MFQAIEGVKVSNPELATVREAMRELSRLLDQLDAGEVEKIVLTQRNQMRAVLLTVERYAELQSPPLLEQPPTGTLSPPPHQTDGIH